MKTNIQTIRWEINKLFASTKQLVKEVYLPIKTVSRNFNLKWSDALSCHDNLDLNVSVCMHCILSSFHSCYCNVQCDISSEEKYSAPSTYTVGEKIKVWYGRGKFLKSYVAKVSGLLHTTAQ